MNLRTRLAAFGDCFLDQKESNGLVWTMNSLNLLSGRVIGPNLPQAPTTSRPRSYSDGTLNQTSPAKYPTRSASQHVKGAQTESVEEEKPSIGDMTENTPTVSSDQDNINEKTPLLVGGMVNRASKESHPPYNKFRLAAERLVAALTESLRWVLSTLVSPGAYLLNGFYDEKGNFSSLLPLRKIGRILPKRSGKLSTAQALGLSGSSISSNTRAPKNVRRKAQPKDLKRKPRRANSSTATSESEVEARENCDTPNAVLKSPLKLHTSSSSEDLPSTRRSMRIKLYNQDTTRKRNQNKEKIKTSAHEQPTLTVANIKSPTSPVSTLKRTRYSHTPAPPRPLIPWRQLSYSTSMTSDPSQLTQKTLVIDLDETLIHSLAKGGRMSSGHMVEVKLNTTVGYGGTTIGPQHPILYYVHKRPHCDEFLRKVCKWYHLIVFTASVQEYADPVIDWLEQERKYFSSRYYRQHCTYRNGAYIKDLSSVEPDLSKVMILDNSPLSYTSHKGKTTGSSAPLLCVLIDYRQCYSHRGLDQRSDG